MERSKFLVSPARKFSITLLSLILLSSLFSAGGRLASAQEIVTPTFTPGTGGNPLDANGSSFYYYVDGVRAPLTLSTEWVSVEFASNEEQEQAAALSGFNATVATEDGIVELSHTGFALVPMRDGVHGSSVVAGVNSMRAEQGDFVQVNPVFQVGDTEMVVTDKFIVTFPGGMTATGINGLNAIHGVEMVEPILGQPNTFVLRVTETSPFDALGMANYYVESGSALTAAPDFSRVKFTAPPPGFGPSFSPDDNYYSDSWHLNNTGQYNGQTRGHSVSDVFDSLPADVDIDAPEAWDIITGDPSIVIAILDEGVDLTHEDLQPNLVPGYDATGLGSAGGPSGDDAHGTATAGLAAAVGNNNEGVTGVCMDCSIMPVRIAYTYNDPFWGPYWVTSDSWIANAITWSYQNGAAILSNSWGGGSASTVINTAFSNAATLGRGGLGSVILVASGNSDVQPVEYPSSLSTVLAVGASNMCDQRKSAIYNQCNGYENWWGSNFGTALDITAPGVFLDTADNTGAPGDNGGNYNIFFNGTSGATPIVAGVAGLVLSANPYITKAQVEAILLDNAEDVNFAVAPGDDIYMGNGRVNAYESLQDSILGSAAIQVDLAGDKVGTYYNPPGTSARKSYPSQDNGPVEISSLNTSPTIPIVASERVIYIVGGKATSFSEIMALPAEQLTNEYWLPYYNNVGLDTQLRFGNTSTDTSTTVSVYIADVFQGSFVLGPSESTRQSFPVEGGPVRIVSSDTNIIAAERVLYLQAGKAVSFSEMMALPGNQLDSEFWLPWYNNVDLDTQLRIANTSTDTTTTVSVYINGDFQNSYVLGPSENVRPSFSGVNNGPVRIISSDTNIAVSERVIYKTAGVNTSYSEMMALPEDQLTTEYMMPYYNNVDLDTQLRFANTSSTTSTNVSVYINGNLQGSFILGPSASTRQSFPGVNNGPVRIVSSATEIIAAERVIYTVDSIGTSFSELMGLPLASLTTDYWLPWYNNVNLDTQVRFGRP
jgi:thermitase